MCNWSTDWLLMGLSAADPRRLRWAKGDVKSGPAPLSRCVVATRDRAPCPDSFVRLVVLFDIPSWVWFSPVVAIISHYIARDEGEIWLRKMKKDCSGGVVVVFR